MSHFGSATCSIIIYLALTHYCVRPMNWPVTLVWRHNVQLLCSHIRALPPRHFAEWIGPGPVGLRRTRFSTGEGHYNRRKDELRNFGPTAAVAMLPASRCRHHSEQHHWKGESRAEMTTTLRWDSPDFINGVRGRHQAAGWTSEGSWFNYRQGQGNVSSSKASKIVLPVY